MYSLLKGQPEIDAASRAALLRDYERFQTGLPDPLEGYIREQYKIDLSSEYGNHFIKNPFGKGSGQLSLNTSQVRRDCEDGLAGPTGQHGPRSGRSCQDRPRMPIPDQRRAVAPDA